MGKTTLSVVLSVRNEEANIGRCLEAVKDIADEIVIVDEYSTDKTVEIAKSYGAKVYEEPHHDIFHITKQIAIDKAAGDWILQLDADEVVSQELAEEIQTVIKLESYQVNKQNLDEKKQKLFQRHQRAIEERDGKIGTDTGEIVAYFIPRRNMFLGRPLIHAGVYPDAVIRLIKKGKAYLPGKSVHEQMVVEGKVGWLTQDLLHYDSPTFYRYLARLNRYTDLKARELARASVPRNLWFLIQYSIVKPLKVFLSLYFRHRGYLDGKAGFVWSLFSAWHYPISYFKYLEGGIIKQYGIER